ncbi:glycosyltransferase family 4 protein [Sphingomonas faeni]|uniref:glycosyltransferase family 4 protein n=1 Tax=Sphingomonas faeni TaxID=185950 RepID=UPI0020C118B0|nr:glycosyltransferase family 4 protein [Sphingomonas faeni]MCK8458394.1 glycosyltransferase family 4 protein [Sphingomonas faeni]
MTTSRDLRIIAQAASATSGENPYTKLLYEGMATRPVRIIPYTRHAVATQSPDVIHIHWPEFLVRWDAGHATMIADVLKEYLLLKAAKARGARIVWTAHDLGAHDRPNAGRVYHWFLKRFNRMVDLIISLSPSALDSVRKRFPDLADTPARVVLHSHYIGYYPPEPVTTPTRQDATRPLTFLMFGQLRRYKNVDGLLRAFQDRAQARALDGVQDGARGERLVIAGEIRGTSTYRDEIHALAQMPGVDFVEGRIDDADVAGLHARADVVVLPYDLGTALHSGAAILALSLNTPVVARDTPTMRDLQAIVGAEWLGLFVGGPDAALEAAVALRAKPRSAAPDLSRMDPERLARETVEAYTAIAVHKRASS